MAQEATIFKSAIDPDFTRPIIVLGDCQRTSLPERLVGREQNDQARRFLIESIVKEKPGLLVSLGDMVFSGASNRDWRYFDALFEPIRREGIPFLPVLGNHDYFGGAEEALQNLKQRFPQLNKSRWYFRIFGGLALVFLDSNINQIEDAAWKEQRLWLDATLGELEEEAAIKGMVVFFHHPPYTNSEVTHDELHVQEAFLPRLQRTRKLLAVVSGHVHGYERFMKGGKLFLVAGSGGGPRVRLLEGESARHLDLFRGSSPRPFVYLKLQVERGGVRLEVKGTQSQELPTLSVFEELLLPFVG